MKVHVRLQSRAGVITFFDDEIEAPSTCVAITRVMMREEIASALHGSNLQLKAEAWEIKERAAWMDTTLESRATKEEAA